MEFLDENIYLCNKFTKVPFDAQDRGLPAPLHKTFTSSHTFVTVPNIFFSLVMSLNFSFHECFKYSVSNLFISLICWSSYFWLEELKSSIEPFQVSFEGVKMWVIVLGGKKSKQCLICEQGQCCQKPSLLFFF